TLSLHDALPISLTFRMRNADFGLRIDKQDENAKNKFNPTRLANPQSEIRIPQSIRPGIVHRLDKDTSGLIVVAKTEEAHEKLAEQFRAREVFKSYVALVHGRIEKDSGSIDQPIA